MAIKNKIRRHRLRPLRLLDRQPRLRTGENVIVVDRVASSFERLDDNFSGYKVTGRCHRRLAS
jgi:hypothetical protein